jgi:hypothetical protein
MREKELATTPNQSTTMNPIRSQFSVRLHEDSPMSSADSLAAASMTLLPDGDVQKNDSALMSHDEIDGIEGEDTVYPSTPSTPNCEPQQPCGSSITSNNVDSNYNSRDHN